MSCTSCRTSVSGAFGSPFGNIRYTCERCTNRQKNDNETEWNRKADDMKADFDLKLKFLSLPFDSEPADEIRKGDVLLIVQGNSDEALHAHRFILATRSTVFSKMFETEMLEGETGVVHIDDATLPVMRAVIKFCYNADITFTDEVTGEDVLVVAHKYAITLLQKTCEEHLIQTFDQNNLPKRLRLAKRIDAPRLETAATKYLKDNFDSVISAVLTELC